MEMGRPRWELLLDEFSEKLQKSLSIGTADCPVKLFPLGIDDVEGRNGKVAEAFRQHVIVDIQNDRDEMLRQQICNIFLW